MAGSDSERLAKCTRQTQHPEVTEMMDLWVSKAMGDRILLTGEVLRQRWTQFADLAGVPKDERLNLSDGWLARFKNWTGLKQMKQHGEAASAESEMVVKERKRIQELIEQYGYRLKDIFNMDETGLFYRCVPFFFSSVLILYSPVCLPTVALQIRSMLVSKVVKSG